MEVEFRLTELVTVGGLAVVLSVLTQLWKNEVPDVWVPRVNVIIGIVLAVGASIALERTTVVDLAEAAFIGLFGAASATGLYKLQDGRILGAKKD